MAIRGRRRLMYLPSVLMICLEAVLFPGTLVLGATISTVELSSGLILVAAVTYAAASLVSMSALRLYTARRSSFAGVILRVAVALAMAAFISSQFYDFVPRLAAASSILAAITIVTFVTTVSIRIAFDCIWDREAQARVVLVLGAGSRAAEIARLQRRADRQGFVVMGYVVTAADQVTAVAPHLRVNVRENLLAYCQRHGIEEIVAAMCNRRHGFPLHEVNECRAAGIAVTGLGAFIERETGRIRLDALGYFSRASSRLNLVSSLKSEIISP